MKYRPKLAQNKKVFEDLIFSLVKAFDGWSLMWKTLLRDKRVFFCFASKFSSLK